MRSETMRSVASGLFIAASLCGIAYIFTPDSAKSEPKQQELSEHEMIDSLTSNGYVVHTSEEWDKEVAKVEDLVKQVEAKEEVKEEKKEETKTKEKIVYRTYLNVSSGMTSIDVGKILQKTKVIKSANSFSKEVERKGKANNLKPGIYVIESGMSQSEIISIIFK